MFSHISLSYFGGMSPVCLGVTAVEILAACDLMRIPAKQRPGLAAKLRLMASAAAEYMNQRAAQSAKPRGR